MRIHTNENTYSNVFDAARAANVDVDVTEHGSRTHERAYEVKLEGSSNSRPNFWDGDPNVYAATWDEWGVFLAHLFRVDPAMRAGGTEKRPAYRDEADFEHQTDERFSDLVMPEDTHKRHRWQYNPGMGAHSCSDCSAIKRQGW